MSGARWITEAICIHLQLRHTSHRPNLTIRINDRTVRVTRCGRICIGTRKINLSKVFAGQRVGINDALNPIEIQLLLVALALHRANTSFDWITNDNKCAIPPRPRETVLPNVARVGSAALTAPKARLSHAQFTLAMTLAREPKGVEEMATPWVARHGLTSAQYQTEFDKLVAAGYRLTDVNGYSVNDTPYFAAIFEKTTGPAWQARHGLNSTQYQQAFDELAGQGYRLARVSGYP